MAEKVKLSKDGSSIDFVQSDNIPTSMKKFRQSPEIEGFYRFIFENDLQREAYKILERIILERKAKRASEKAAMKESKTKSPAAIKPASPGKTAASPSDVQTKDSAGKNPPKTLAVKAPAVKPASPKVPPTKSQAKLAAPPKPAGKPAASSKLGTSGQKAPAKKPAPVSAKLASKGKMGSAPKKKK